ncbi:ISL3 family transposase [Sagittula stellata E-37]|uniref:ISL3 family transposase n=1 Tax=Sagittula stellata (strain ATCC 700073 / DSM 11524 / E-37) TaxID=388399 RepID=A3JZF1_SAGS3|nr:ISL3 family transposase [Sagittula stellata E-37]
MRSRAAADHRSGSPPGREPATIETWLRSQPQIEVVARDRNGGAVTRALPQAVQVADRWHLLETVSVAFLAAVRRSMPTIRRAVGASELDPALLTGAERLQYDGFQRRKHTNETVGRMTSEGVPVKRIVRTTGLSRGLVRQIVCGERDDVFRVRQNGLTPWLLRLEEDWVGGCRNATELWRRLRTSGFGGSLRVVGEWATRQRRAENAMLAGNGKCPPARRIALLMTSARNHLSKADAVLVAQVEAALPALAAGGSSLIADDPFQEGQRGARRASRSGHVVGCAEIELSVWPHAQRALADRTACNGAPAQHDTAPVQYRLRGLHVVVEGLPRQPAAFDPPGAQVFLPAGPMLVVRAAHVNEWCRIELNPLFEKAFEQLGCRHRANAFVEQFHCRALAPAAGAVADGDVDAGGQVRQVGCRSLYVHGHIRVRGVEIR